MSRFYGIGKIVKKKLAKDEIDHPFMEQLAREHACYVLITCDPPGATGNMQVNMHYEGEPLLLSYLIRDAQTMIDQSIEEEA